MGILSQFLRFRRTRALAAFDARDTGWDLQSLTIDTTSSCNIRCKTCSLQEWHPDHGVMSLESFRRLSGVLPRLRCITFSNSAEPLLNPELFEMIGIAKRATRGLIRVAFTTNGTLLTDRTFRSIVACGLDAIEVSLDGATKKTYEEIREGASFEQVISNIERLVRISGENRHRIPHVSLRLVACEMNVGELPAVVDLAHRLGVTHIAVNGLVPHSEEMASKALYGPQRREEVSRLFEEVSQKASQLGMRLDLPAPVPVPVTRCGVVSNTCLLLANGSVVPCSPVAYRRPFFHRGERRELPEHSFGNINERSLWDIWHSPRYMAFREDVKEGRMREFCEDCPHMSEVLCSQEHWKWLSS
jgi:radical SAM protein with 4Fe4S-binding SPASM domain